MDGRETQLVPSGVNGLRLGLCGSAEDESTLVQIAHPFEIVAGKIDNLEIFDRGNFVRASLQGEIMIKSRGQDNRGPHGQFVRVFRRKASDSFFVREYRDVGRPDRRPEATSARPCFVSQNQRVFDRISVCVPDTNVDSCAPRPEREEGEEEGEAVHGGRGRGQGSG